MKSAVFLSSSPFVNGAVVARIVNKQLDLVKSNQKTPADAMKTAAAQINADENGIREDPELKKKYEELTRKRMQKWRAS